MEQAKVIAGPHLFTLAFVALDHQMIGDLRSTTKHRMCRQFVRQQLQCYVAKTLKSELAGTAATISVTSLPNGEEKRSW